MMNPNPAQFGGSFQQPPQQQQQGCLGRNWKWMLPVGCLGLILAGVVLIGIIFFGVLSAIKSSEAYQGALKVVQTHPAAVERLGQPVKDGWFVKGNINIAGSASNANFEVPVSGPKNSGTLYVRAVSPEGIWMYERLDLSVGGETISLLDRNVALPHGSEVDVEEDADDGADVSEADEAVATDTEASSPKVISSTALDDKAISKPVPPYPPAARAARASGTVRVFVLVDTSGKVISATATAGHPLLRPAAVAAAKQARFSPVLLNGNPTEFAGTLTYNFVLEQ